MNEIEQAIFSIIMKHMRINSSEYCSTAEFESDVEGAAREIAAQHSVQKVPFWLCVCGRTYSNVTVGFSCSCGAVKP